jgi:UDP-N-acetylglucosamine acyltransferase
MTTIHPTAIVDPKAELAEDVAIGPYAVIGPHVSIGPGTRVMSHVVIDGHTSIGARNEFFPMASIGQKTQDLKYAGGTCYLAIGDDNTFREFVTVNTATTDGQATVVGSHNHIMAYCHIAHECVIGDNVIMSNLATLAGHVIVEDYAVIGGMGGIHQFCRLGRMSMVGACTKINQDVVPCTVVEGNPAAPAGVNVVRMKRLGHTEDEVRAVKESYRLVYRQQLKAREAVAAIREAYGDHAEALHIAEFIQASERGIVR